MATGIPITLYCTVGGFLLTTPLLSGQPVSSTDGPWWLTTTRSYDHDGEESDYGAVIGVSIAVALLLIAGLVVGADKRRRKALGQRHIARVPELQPSSPRSMVYSVTQQGGASDRFHQSVHEYLSASQVRNSSRPHAASDSQNQGYSNDAFTAPVQFEGESVPVTVVDPLSPPSYDDIMQSELKRCTQCNNAYTPMSLQCIYCQNGGIAQPPPYDDVINYKNLNV